MTKIILEELSTSPPTWKARLEGHPLSSTAETPEVAIGNLVLNHSERLHLVIEVHTQSKEKEQPT